MKHLFFALLVAHAALPQVAEHANKDLHSEEGRRRMIGLLSDPGRADRLEAGKLLNSLGLKEGDVVVDLGTGAGIMLPFLSKAVGPSGKVLAEDIVPDFLDKARESAKQHGLTNVEFILGGEKDPNLPANAADLVITVDVYHHFDYPAEMLAAIRKTLRDRGRLVIVDYYKEGFRDPEHIRIDKAAVVEEVSANGFRLLSNEEHIPGSQYRLVFEKR
ncbi:MAG: methyltransferase domain-containing protein [Bryobacteraceae bacterium]|nr:methyltransferase domain-containing protein [Bryobacteraceae bacterium]